MSIMYVAAWFDCNARAFCGHGTEIAPLTHSTNKHFMNRRTFIPILLVLAVISIAYAIYRSTSQTITQVENGHQVVYGQPMHGLMLGLCVFAAACILGVVILMDKSDAKIEERVALSKRTLNT